MQQTQSNGFRGGGTMMQSMLQLLLSRVQSNISNTASVVHLSGRNMRDLQQIALRGPPLTMDDLVSLYAASTHIIHISHIYCVARVRRRYREPPWHNQ